MGIEIIDFFDMSKDHPLYEEVRRILIDRGKHPEMGSEFERKTFRYRNLPDEEFLDALKKDKYNVLVIYDDMPDGAYFHGYAAYQREKNKMGIFELKVDEEVEGNPKLIAKLIRDSFKHVRSKEIREIIFDKDSRELVNFLKTKEKRWNVSIILESNKLRLIPTGVVNPPAWLKI